MTKIKKQNERVGVAELSEWWSISRDGVLRFLSHPAAPKRAADGTWNRLEVLQYREQRLARSARKVGEPDSITEARRWKLMLECEKLRVQIAELKRDLVPKAEVVDLLSELAMLVGAVFDQWTSEVSGLTGDAHLVEEAERLTGRMRARLREEVRARREPA